MGLMVSSSTCALLLAATPRPRTIIEACSGAVSPSPTRTDALIRNDRPGTGVDRVGRRQAPPADTTAAAAIRGRMTRKDFTVPCSVKDDRITTYTSIYAGPLAPAERVRLSCGRKPLRGSFEQSFTQPRPIKIEADMKRFLAAASLLAFAAVSANAQ